MKYNGRMLERNEHPEIDSSPIGNEYAGLADVFVHQSTEHVDSGIEGVEAKSLFPSDEQARLMQRIGEWFDGHKEMLEGRGISITVSRVTAEGTLLDSLKNSPAFASISKEAEIPVEVIELFDAIMHDSAKDAVLGQRNIKLALRRTGDTFTHPDNLQFHLDTSKYNIAEDGSFTRDPARSVGKYMAFIGRPGTQVIHGRINPRLTQQEGTALAPAPDAVNIDEQTVSQLLPNNVYWVETGNVLHNAPSHEDGLLFEVSFDE